ncbi:hypothetical protein PO909_009337, partial [Leuciscus waleckii]
ELIQIQHCWSKLALSKENTEPKTTSSQKPQKNNNNAGLLERAQHLYRDTKTKVLNVGSTAAGFVGMYFEDHLKPVADSYMEWAKDGASSLWERLKRKVPTFRSTQDK